MVVGGDFSATGLARPVCIEVAENPVYRELQNSARQRLVICARIDITFDTLLRMRRLAFFVAFLFAGLSSANAQWDIEDSNTTASLRGIHNVGGGVAWASGTNGTVLFHRRRRLAVRLPPESQTDVFSTL